MKITGIIVFTKNGEMHAFTDRKEYEKFVKEAKCHYLFAAPRDVYAHLIAQDADSEKIEEIILILESSKTKGGEGEV